MNWSFLQRSPTACVRLIVRDLETSKRGGLGPIWAVPPQKKLLIHNSKVSKRNCLVFFIWIIDVFTRSKYGRF
jgi:hypothetical protein